MKLESRDKILKCLTNSLKREPGDLEYTPELIDFRQMKIQYICLGQGLEEKCLWKDLNPSGTCRFQSDRITFIECLKGIV